MQNMAYSRSGVLFKNVFVRNIFKHRKSLQSSVDIQRNSANVAFAQAIATDYETALPYEKIPGPSTLPIIGSLHHFMLGGKYANMDLYQLCEKLHVEYGNTVRLGGLPGKPDLVSIYDFDDIEKVYRTEGIWPSRIGPETREHYLKNIRHDTFKSVIGLVHSQGEEWQKIRSKVNQPMMQMKITKQYVGWIEEIANDFIERLRTLLDAEGNVPENFIIEVDRWSLESIARIAVDTRLGCLSPNITKDSDAMKIITSLQRFFVLGYELDILPSIWKYYKTPKFNELMESFDVFTNITVKHISQAIKRLEEKSLSEENNLSVLEKLLKIDPQVAIIMALDMFFAGVDTTASASINTMYYLATNPEKQSRLRKEIRAVFAKGEPLTAEGLSRLSYLKACFKETHRLRPVAVGNSRFAGTDLNLGGYKIPKGTNLLLQHHIAAKFSNEFPEYDRYLPERWLRSDTEGAPPARTAHKFAYMPFGFGPRMCVGRRFAELEMEVLLCRMISEFHVDWTADFEMQMKTSLISGPTGPMKFKLTPLVEA